jgi:membrane associated rhomboid family serine protease
MNTFWQNILSRIQTSGSKLYLLIGINVVVFLIINVPAIFEQLFTGFGNSAIIVYSNEYLSIPAYLPKLLVRFWTPLTYMFMHSGWLHILFNMLWLYWFGQIFEEFLGTKRIVGVYLLGGLAGAFFFVLSYNVFPVFAQILPLSTAVGASASVMAIMVATATLLPDYSIPLIFIGPVKLKWIALAMVIIDYLSIAGPNSGGEIAHLGGALMGFVYIKRLQKGSDWVANIAGLFKSGPRLSKLKVVARNNNKRSSSRPRQEDVDLILDKISNSGYESLTTEEKEILFRASKNES